MRVKDLIEVLENLPSDAKIERISNCLSIVTENTYQGEYIFDMDDPNLPDWSKPDEKG